MKMPDILDYEFIMEPGIFNSVSQFESALGKFFKANNIGVSTTRPLRGQGDRGIMILTKMDQTPPPPRPKK